jgi:hypothetical protein
MGAWANGEKIYGVNLPSIWVFFGYIYGMQAGMKRLLERLLLLLCFLGCILTGLAGGSFVGELSHY